MSEFDLDASYLKSDKQCKEPCEDETCQEHCDHGDMDEGICLDCGLDRREELSAQAYDRMKDMHKYGDC